MHQPAIEDKFIHFMPKFFPRLMKGLEAVDQMHICSTAVQVVGDVTRALEEQYAQFADETVTKLLATVKVHTYTHAHARSRS